MNPILMHLECLIGDKECFQESTLESLLDRGLVSSQAQLERALHVFEYLAQLGWTGLDSVFKGGSAVQLLLPTGLQRLSVDLDIAVSDRESLQECVGQISDKFSNDI